MNKIKLYLLRHGDIESVYTIDYTGPEEFTTGMAGDVVRHAKEKFSIPGKQFVLLFLDKVFYITKLGPDWKFYELEKAGYNTPQQEEINHDPE